MHHHVRVSPERCQFAPETSCNHGSIKLSLRAAALTACRPREIIEAMGLVARNVAPLNFSHDDVSDDQTVIQS
jgi:hypothetical protein